MLCIKDRLKVCVKKIDGSLSQMFQLYLAKPSGPKAFDGLAALIASSVSQERKLSGSLSVRFSIIFLLVFLCCLLDLWVLS